jgi:uncharacterized membrane protein YfcA
VNWLAIVMIGAAVGFFGGMFGKGGSAIATPLLAAVGVPPIIAVASPLPATIPGLLVAYRPYRRLGLQDSQVLRWSIIAGVPATVLGALATRYVDASALVMITEAVVAAIGVRILLRPEMSEVADPDLGSRRLRVILVAGITGFLAGLLANAGGFLLVPLYLAVLKLPIKTALACSLVVAAALAVPGTIVHAAMGHIDWTVTLVFGAASIPLSGLGARVALRIHGKRLERIYALMLVVLGTTLLMIGLV